MMQNPFLTPPQVESPQSRSWAQGFFWGFEGPAASALSRDGLEIEDNDAFDTGVLEGQRAAIEGLELDQTCIDLNAEPPALLHPFEVKNVPEAFDVAVEAGSFAAELAKLELGAALGSGVMLALGLAIGLETFSDDPTEALEAATPRLQERMSEMGFGGNLRLFMGGGLDTAQRGCELKVTRIFRRQEDATAAAKALGRPNWLVVSWRTDQSGGAEVVGSG